MKISVCLLCIFLVSSFSSFLVPSQKESRFDNISIPVSRLVFLELPRKVFDYIPAITPIHRNLQDNEIVEICSTTEFILSSRWSSLWKNSSILNPCEIYFCQNSTQRIAPRDMSRQGDTNIIQDTILNLDKRIHDYCMLCSNTFEQNFTLNYEKCPYLSKECEYACASSYKSTCIYFRNTYNFCYVWDLNKFMRYIDFTHIFSLWIYAESHMYLFLISFTLLFIFHFIFILIPEIGSIINYLKEPNVIQDKVYRFFSIRIQIIIILFIVDCLFILTSIIDLISFTYAYIISLYLNTFFMFFIFCLIVVLWLHICESAEVESRLSLKHKIYLLICFVLFALFGLIGLIILGCLSLGDPKDLYIYRYASGAYYIIYSAILFAFSIIINLVAIRTLILMNSVDFTKIGNLIKLKLTRFVIIISFGILFVELISLNFGISEIFGMDYISMHLGILIQSSAYLAVVLLYLILHITMVDSNLVKRYFCCKNNS